MSQRHDAESATPDTFLALDPAEHTLDRSRIVVLPAPYDGTASYRSGARDGPLAIIRASAQMEDYDPELGFDPCDAGIYTAPALAAPALAASALGPNSSGPEAMANRVAEAVEGYVRQGKLVCMLGGEHSLTSGAVRVMARQHTDLSVLVLDAHADLRDEYQGSRYSHACAARRILDHAPVTLAGVRSMTGEEATFAAAQGVPLYARGAEPLADLDAIVATLSANVYVSVDLDVLDPSIMAAVGTPEPGGMGWWETLRLLRAVAERRRIVGVDVMELAPVEGPEACTYTAAKLAYKLMSYATALATRP